MQEMKNGYFFKKEKLILPTFYSQYVYAFGTHLQSSASIIYATMRPK